VIYSLGNFISAQDGTMKRVGMIAGFDINKTFENGKTTIKIENPRADLIWTYHQYYKNFKVIPFTELNDSLLPGYKSIYEQYKPIITKYDSNVKIGV
jgi:poly-gamma-glutamate synthesis protein (capsule biosynthesis protein)